MCFMPINSAFANLFGFRRVCFVGGIFYSLGLVLTTISPNIYVFYLTFGLTMGWSGGLILMSWMPLVAFYFEKRRALATGLAISGSGVGVAILPILSSALLLKFGWQGVFFMFGGNIFFFKHTRIYIYIYF